MLLSIYCRADFVDYLSFYKIDEIIVDLDTYCTLMLCYNDLQSNMESSDNFPNSKFAILYEVKLVKRSKTGSIRVCEFC